MTASCPMMRLPISCVMARRASAIYRAASRSRSALSPGLALTGLGV
jgi:hypothetical protein